MEQLHIKNILNAKDKAIQYLNTFIETKQEEYLQKAITTDNTNSKIIYYYLENLKEKDRILYNNNLDKYRLFINEEYSKKMNLTFMDHQKDIIDILNSVKQIDINTLNVNSLKDALEKCYPRKYMEYYKLNGNKRINNIPLDLNDEFMFNFSIKVLLGEKLYSIADTKVPEDDEKNRKIYMEIKKECLSYLKIVVEIMIYFFKKEKKIVYNLLNIIDFSEEKTDDIDNQIYYYLKIMGKDINDLSKEKGYKFSDNFLFFYKSFADKFENYKTIYFDLIEKILRSKCIQDLLIELKNYHNDNNNIIKINDDFIDYIKKNTIFFEFIRPDIYGITNVRELKTLINIDYRSINLNQKYTILFLFCIFIITAIHEYIGHLLKEYYYYSSNFIISETSPKRNKKNETNEEDDEEEEDDDNEIEKIFFNNIHQIFIGDVLYILDIKNWEKNLNDFSAYFHSGERKRKMKKKKININKKFFQFLSNFQIEEEELTSIKSDVSMKCKNSNYPPYMIYTGGCRTHKINKYSL